MDTRYLLDTNICIYIRQKRPEEVLRRFRKLRPGEAGLSVITYGELLYGAAKSKQRDLALERLHELIALMPVLALPEEAAEAYGTIRADVRRLERDTGLKARINQHRPNTSVAIAFPSTPAADRLRACAQRMIFPYSRRGA
jgi:predicted nucleic acid-binding protein